MSILELFCHVDDFCQWMATWENAKLLGVARKRGPAPRLSLSEVDDDSDPLSSVALSRFQSVLHAAGMQAYAQ